MSKKILVAEDSSVIQNLTRRILSLQNYKISSVKNGAQVLELLNKEPFDLVLLDIHMPIMDGMECAQEIRKLPKDMNGAIPIIAITGNANNYSEDEFKRVGIDYFLPKPLNYDTLVETVNSFMTNGN
ncbi:response regulator [Marinoscillum sp. MHG1-6]|uniref:response regulator n=1 Tax=Marinoscillum sp. MHG1-6 TaxID=2959627 RepID=UPI00215722D2|nr:response regulator [Marinoscillum sp. MHG1-6]